MACTSEQIELIPQLLETPEPKGSTENVNIKMRKSFSWDRAFFTSDGVLDAEELSRMIEGGEKDVEHRLQGIEKKLCRSMDSVSALENDNLALESLETKLFEDIKASTQKSTETSNPTNTSIKVPTASLSPTLSSMGSSTPIKTEPTRSSPLSGSSGSSSVNNAKSSATLARRNKTSKTGKAAAGSTSKTPSGTSTKGKVNPVNSRLPSHLVPSNLSPRTSPAGSSAQWSSESSSSTSDVNRRSISRGSKGKPTVDQRSISRGSKGKPNVDQRSMAKGGRGTSVHHRSLYQDASAKSALKNRPTVQNSYRNGKPLAAVPPRQTGSLSYLHVQSRGCGMPSAKIRSFDGGKSGTSNRRTRTQSCLPAGSPGATHGSRTGSSNGAKNRNQALKPPKTVAARTGLKPNSHKAATRNPSQNKSSAKAKPSSSASRGARSLLVVSPEVLDIKGKINALKMEISMQKKETFKEIKKAPAESGATASSSNQQSSKIDTKGKDIR